MTDICFISPRIYHYFADNNQPAGGAQRQQYLLANELVERGYSISAIVGDYGQPSVEVYNGVELIKGAPETVGSPTDILSAVVSLKKAMHQSGATIFFVRGAPRLAVATHILSYMNDSDFVFCVANDSDVDQEYLDKRYNTLLKKGYLHSIQGASSVISQTEKQQQTLKRELNRSSTHIPNGYTLPPEDELIPHSERNNVLWVGSSDPDQKKPERFVELARALPEVDFKMISQHIPGKEQYHRHLEEVATSISNLNFLGELPPDDVHQHYQRAALYVNTSANEGFPNTFLEAWRYATPVVSVQFDLDGLLEQQKIGTVTGSVSNTSQWVQELIDDPQHRHELGNNGREYMEEHFSLKRVTDLYCNVFDEYLAE